jgi:cytochrome c oxidase assembly protein subunit 11
MSDAARNPNIKRRRIVAGVTIACVGAMLGLSYAAVPLYAAFCKATGYGGTTQVATAAPQTKGSRKLTVHFDANVAPGLPWSFEPETSAMEITPGQTVTAFYKVRNTSSRATAATAVYNVAPDVTGAWFNKISCFCFDEQKLGPNETAELPVVFFLDPALEKDEAMNAVSELTLSYTFYAAKAAVKPVASAETKHKTKPQL